MSIEKQKLYNVIDTLSDEYDSDGYINKAIIK